MAWLIASLFLVFVLEFMTCYLPEGSVRRVSSYVCIVFIGLDSLLILVARPSIWALLIVYLSAFRVFNIFKLIDGRKQIDFLRSSFLRSSISLVVYQWLVLVVTYLISATDISFQVKWIVLISLELIGLAVVGMSLRRNLFKTRPRLPDISKENSKLPSLTVAIPARNETTDLDECLKCLVDSDYPKLEVLVLDDCSQEKRTPEIIRQFAHDGVRFLSGKIPDDSWTAKNFAYEQLYEESNGEIVLFCGVDARFDRQALRKMVELKISKNKSMVSFMPVNDLPASKFRSLLIQPLRYLWEIGLPRRSLNRPPVLSTCWLIDKEALKANGSFKAVARSIVPERYFARQTARTKDGYSFICLGNELGFSSSKSFDEQLETGLRTRYPLLKQRLEHVSVLSLIELLLFISPIALLIYELFEMNWTLVFINIINMLIASLVLFRISKLAYARSLPVSLIVYPVVFAYDIGLLIYSMWLYEFREVVWKGRNVCIPAMGVISPSEFESKLD